MTKSGCSPWARSRSPGIGAEVPFAKDLLDKIGVTAEFSHKGIYKSMPESLTRTNMSDPNREMTTALVGDLSQQIVAGIAADRKLTVEDVRAKIDRAPFDDKDALAAGLIDHIGYYDEMMDEAKKRAGAGDDNVVNLTGYAFLSDSAMKNGMVGFTTKLMRSTSPPGTYKDKNKIALIYGVGDIVPYTSQTHGSLIDGEGGMAAEKVVEAFHAAMKDPDVVAVVFRIDSPGGSPEAAESIRRAMVEMQKKGRPRDRVHEQLCRVRRLLDRGLREQDRGRARDRSRFHRRVRRQDRGVETLGQDRTELEGVSVRRTR